jgi:hypothetical protein
MFEVEQLAMTESSVLASSQSPEIFAIAANNSKAVGEVDVKPEAANPVKGMVKFPEAKVEPAPNKSVKAGWVIVKPQIVNL